MVSGPFNTQGEGAAGRAPSNFMYVHNSHLHTVGYRISAVILLTSEHMLNELCMYCDIVYFFMYLGIYYI